MSPKEDVRFLVFDIESVADPKLVANVRFPHEEIDENNALRQYRDELMEKKGSDFVPYTFQIPISLALAKVRGDYSLIDIKVLDNGPENICRTFWNGWLHYQKPTLITFNGRGFDIPLLELTAFRFGIPIPEWLAWGARSYDQPRYRYNYNKHFDLCDFLTNNGAVQFTGGLNLASKIIQKPGKIDTKGDMVQDIYDEGNLEQIHQYCRCDVLDTYFVFLRLMLLNGQISANQEKALIDSTKEWLKTNAEAFPVYQLYLDAWNNTENSDANNQQ
ncbi:MAG: 3'-5' exonuclease [Planctomycetia bacterium]|nr:3'-5' exonuclease [Planctomycetia bacterium]